jgi:hypothetical protein
MNPSAVIPAKAGIHFDFAVAWFFDAKRKAKSRSKWIPAFAGMTNAIGFAPYD